MTAKRIHIMELPGTEDAFNLAGETVTDWDRIKREHQRRLADQTRAEQRQVKLFDQAGLEPGSHWT